MANFLDKLKVKTALDERVKLDLGCDHITTANFMQFNVAYCKELVPKEKISVNMETFTRLNPMPVPTFGRAKINNRAFFVPFRTIWPAWNEFITDVPVDTVTGPVQYDTVPTITNQNFLDVLFDLSDYSNNTEWANPVEEGELSDYDIVNNTGEIIKRVKLTSKGRHLVKMLESLGYKIVPVTDVLLYFSALPLMAMAKVYSDWYYPSAYANLADISKINAMFNMNMTDFSATLVESIFEFLSTVNYDSDYFVSAWDNPVGPNQGAYSRLTIDDVTLDPEDDFGNVRIDAQNGTPVHSGTLAQFGIDALKRLTDYMKRHQLVGARALDRYLARFGVNLSAEKLKRSVYVGSGYENIQFGDVMSTADTTGASLGNYAGKGIGYGACNFDYDTDEYGMFIIVSSIVPNAGYYQGINRNVLHLAKTDFWTPEFDNLGTQAISKAELYVPQSDYGDFFGIVDMEETEGKFNQLVNGVFGWTPRYAEYKVGRDMLTGDFRYNSINTGTEAWHTMRELGYSDPESIVHNVEFVKGTDADQYSRIFYNTDADAADKFNIIYHFEIASWSPMKALFDTYEFDSKGKSVVEDVNGVKMN